MLFDVVGLLLTTRYHIDQELYIRCKCRFGVCIAPNSSIGVAACQPLPGYLYCI